MPRSRQRPNAEARAAALARPTYAATARRIASAREMFSRRQSASRASSCASGTSMMVRMGVIIARHHCLAGGLRPRGPPDTLTCGDPDAPRRSRGRTSLHSCAPSDGLRPADPLTRSLAPTRRQRDSRERTRFALLALLSCLARVAPVLLSLLGSNHRVRPCWEVVQR
jgi:hypothetical protein